MLINLAKTPDLKPDEVKPVVAFFNTKHPLPEWSYKPPKPAKKPHKPQVVSYTVIQPKTPYIAPQGVWQRLAACESGGNWAYNGPSGFDGAFQFLPSTWDAMNTGYDFAWQAPPSVQLDAAKRLQARSGWHSQWPACAARLGLL